MNPSANTVEIHLPPAGVSKMVWAISLFSLVGLIASLTTLGELSKPWRSFSTEALVTTFIASLTFIFGIAGLLVWQLARIVSTHQESVKHTIHKAQFEPLASLPPPSPPVYAHQGSIASVAEHTTRQMAGKVREPHAPE
jgi:hypothetical protein